MSPELRSDGLRNRDALRAGLTLDALTHGVEAAYRTLDTIDEQLLQSGSERLASILELANVSAIFGNLLAAGIVRASNGVFTRAGPHKYQDLRASSSAEGAENIEIKVALEKNTPKGHLAKEGYYLTSRYVLCDEKGDYTKGERGDVIWVWELRFGYLDEEDFNLSNTPGDSGKTAVVNREGMSNLTVVYFDVDRCPYGLNSNYFREHLGE